MYIPLLRYVDKLITQKIYCCFTPHIYFTVKQFFEPLCLLIIGNHRRSNTTALVRNNPKTFIRLEYPNKLSFYPKKRCLLVWLITAPQLNELPNDNCDSNKNKYTNKADGYYCFRKLHWIHIIYNRFRTCSINGDNLRIRHSNPVKYSHIISN